MLILQIPQPPLQKGDKKSVLFSPFEKGGLRGIFFVNFIRIFSFQTLSGVLERKSTFLEWTHLYKAQIEASVDKEFGKHGRNRTQFYWAGRSSPSP